jgi:hypothetical protein
LTGFLGGLVTGNMDGWYIDSSAEGISYEYQEWLDGVHSTDTTMNPDYWTDDDWLNRYGTDAEHQKTKFNEWKSKIPSFPYF